MSSELLATLAGFLGMLVAAVAALAAVLWLNQRLRGALSSRRPGAAPGVEDAIILFQSMRDMLEQQKALAYDLNEALNRKVATLREALARHEDRIGRLRAEEQALSARLTAARRKLEAIETRLRVEPAGTHAAETSIDGNNAVAPETAPDSSVRDQTRDAAGPGSSALARDGAGQVVPDPAPPRPDVRPEQTGAAVESNDSTLDETASGGPQAAPGTPERGQPPASEDSLFDSWAGFSMPKQFEPPDGQKEEEEDGGPLPLELPERAPREDRQAIKSLLDLDSAVPDIAQAPEFRQATAPRGPLDNGGNAAPLPLHARVFDYHDAGMSVTEIASELGIGKGEVRLILNLRRPGAS